MVMQSVFAVVDIYFIGRLGQDAVAAAGMTDSMLTLVFSIAMGLSMAAAAMVSAAHRRERSGTSVARGGSGHSTRDFLVHPDRDRRHRFGA